MRTITVKGFEPNELEELSAAADALLERIRQRADEIAAIHGSAPGRDLDNWLEAEREFVWTPPAELIDSGKEFRLRIAVPGFTPEQLEVRVSENALFVEGEKQSQIELTGGHVVFSEYSQGQLFRRIPLAEPVDVSAAAATLDNGELCITVPKKVVTEEALAATA